MAELRSPQRMDRVFSATTRGRPSGRSLYSDYIGDGFDRYMDFEELGVHLHGLLEFPADLLVENEGPRV